MSEIIRIGMDTSKHFFQLHGVDAGEKAVLRKQLRRQEMVAFFRKLEPTEIGLEACGASHYWARTLTEMGHQVKLLPPQLVKPYIKRNKNDARDAEGVCEAMSRPTMRFVPVKTAQQQADLMLVGMRDQLMKRRTEISNRIRGWAGEHGVTAPRGLNQIAGLLADLAGRADIPETARWVFAQCADEYAYVNARLAQVDAKLMAWHRNDEQSIRLAEVPIIGPIGAALLTMKAPHASLFRKGRDLSAWVGLTPKDHSTANKRRIGCITRAGDEQLRATLVAGAASVLQQAQRRMKKGQPVAAWIASLLTRKAFKEAAVALANKVVRIAWKLMVSGERFDPSRAPEIVTPGAPARRRTRSVAPAAPQTT
jgi:transposase